MASPNPNSNSMGLTVPSPYYQARITKLGNQSFDLRSIQRTLFLHILAMWDLAY
ncbi:hypothetical protein CCACVL1_08335 [Corchorus capsularis]|uniref:Uncharacterized protein n=1 Tax=Corchorus capsularis TaxID=210143 RepID=A0A1R3J153_COCAP|nr:hypothetical protein CCACVL1_08335 [Corchorus capsularis]